eukprot:5000332-Prymnesium_polylepis.1
MRLRNPGSFTGALSVHHAASHRTAPAAPTCTEWHERHRRCDANAARTGRPALMCAVHGAPPPQPLTVARRCGGGAGAP